MTFGERIRKLRRTQDLTQQEFADRIGVKRNTVATYEIGRSEPVDAVFSLICREFNVSEKWLRTGDGEMFVKKEPQPLDKLLSELLGGKTVTDADRTMVKNFLELPENSRKAVIKFVQKCAGELSVLDANPDIHVPAAPSDLATEIVELKRQNQEKDKQLQELAAEVAAMKEEDAGMEAAAELSAWPSVSAGSLSPVEKAKK